MRFEQAQHPPNFVCENFLRRYETQFSSIPLRQIRSFSCAARNSDSMASADAGVNSMSSANPNSGPGNVGTVGVDPPTPDLPYLGSKISLISNAEIRYEGTLHSINPAESTVSLRFVRSFGTEGRKEPHIAPSNDIYDHVVFRGLDIKDLTVCSEPESAQQVFPTDPAIVSVNTSADAGLSSHVNFDGGSQKAQSRRETNVAGPLIPTDSDTQGGMWGGVIGRNGWMNMGSNRSLGSPSAVPPPMQSDYKNHHINSMGYHYQGHSVGNSGQFHSRGRRGLHGVGGYNYTSNKYNASGAGRYARQIVGELPSKPNEQLRSEMAQDFDFQSMNSKFQKPKQLNTDLMKPPSPASNSRSVEQQPNETNDYLKVGSYNKNTSFFDSISCEALDRQQGREEKVDRHAQRQLDVDTFGAYAANYRPMLGGAGKRGGRGRGRGGRGRMGGYHHGNVYHGQYVPRNFQSR